MIQKFEEFNKDIQLNESELKLVNEAAEKIAEKISGVRYNKDYTQMIYLTETSDDTYAIYIYDFNIIIIIFFFYRH